MPNKESFTFSDKLRKSKSVPLSKRLPSIVGGKNTQKRTLVQRAQRDLPFILVAALALLLLPFLSRTGSDDIAGTGDLAWNTLADAPSFAEGGGADIMPAGAMQDPLDLILRPRSDMEGSAVTMGADASKSAYGSSDEDGTGSSSGYSRSRAYSTTGSSSTKRPDYTTRKEYDSEYTKKTTKAPATTTYGKKTRPSVRKSFERKGTDINRALRVSQMAGGKGGSGVSHTLPIGQGPTRGGGTAFREGIRPVALQPMEARGGVGRSMTGENLYAEAARSARAMNAGGPAKANLLAAQMRDVDGQLTPESAGFGGPGAGGPGVRPGAGGGPGNNNAYNLGKPWWWDMMQARSQKMWDLLYYKPREMFYTNLYKIGLGIFNCLATGNKDGDVSTLFGEGGSTDDYICVDPNTHKKIEGTIKASKHAKKFSNTTESGSKDSAKTATDAGGAFDSWSRDCEKKGGIPWGSGSDDKNFFEVRAECLGLDVLFDGIKARIKHTKYDSHCEGVNNDPISFDLDIERSNAKGKHNTRKERKLAEKSVITLLAKVKEGTYKGQEIVVFAGIGNHLDHMSSTAWNAAHDNCTLSRLVAFTSRKGSLNVEQKVSRYNAEDEARQVSANLAEGTEDGIMMPSISVIPEQGQVTAANMICQGKKSNAKPLTLSDIRNRAELGRGKKDSYAECNIWETRPEIWDKYIHGSKCGDHPEIGVNIKEHVEFRATIDNSADKHVYAVLVDEIQGETKAKVSYIQDFGLKSNKGLIDCDDNGSCTYKFSVDVASLGWNFNEFGKSVKGMQGQITNTMTGSELLEGQRESNANISNNASETTAAKERMYYQAFEAYKACLEANRNADKDNQQQCVPPQDTTQYASFNSTSGSSSQGAETAPGSGIIFWIVTNKKATLKVNQHDDLGKPLGQVDISDLIESNETVVFSLCRYKWCKDVAKCNVQRGDGSVCYKTGEDGRPHYYNYVSKRLKGEELLISTIEYPDYAPNGQEPTCSELCKSKDDNGKMIINCPHGKTITLEEAQQYLDTGLIDLIPLCNPYCQYKNKAYKATDIDGEFYITDAEPMSINPDGLPYCHPLAWAWEDGDFRIYDFVDEYDDSKLPLIPNRLMDATSATNTDYTVNLRYLEQSHLFTIIRNQAIDSGNPREFKLFPRLVLPTPNLDLLDNCTLCGELPFDNASVEIDSGKFSDTERNVTTCLKEIQELRTLGLIEDDELRNLYFYGYASKRGSHSPEMLPNDSGGKSNIGCTTNGCKGTDVDGCWAGCNYALSEDRSLSIIEELINGINSDSSFDPSIKVTKERTYTNRGFSNAKPDTMVDKSTHRLNRASQANILSLLNTSNPEFNFVSYPCGSDGAKKAYNLKPSEQLRDRYVLITPINNGDDYCENRMTCDMAKDAMETLKEKIKDRMNDKGIKAPKTTSTKKQSTTASISFGSSSDGEYISTGEELDLLPGDAYQVASIIQALHSCREDIQSGKYRYPQICNSWIEDANELLGFNKNEGIVPNGDLNLTITRQKQLLERYDSVGVKEVLKKLNFEYAII